jgi:hydrogenase/urease accessory protein HupE
VKRLLILFALACVPSLSWAHALNLAVAFLRVDGNEVIVRLTVTGTDVDRAAGVNISDPTTNVVMPLRLVMAAETLRNYFDERIALRAAGTDCTRKGITTISADSDGGIAVESIHVCATTSDIVYRSRAMLDFDREARQAVQLFVVDRYVELDLLSARHDETVLVTGWRTTLRTFARFVAFGVEHIFIGPDHIAFIVAILLWATRFWTLVKIVTAFTLAHSITLSLAVLGIVDLPSRVVEAAIAASVIVVALENFFSRDVDRRWPWTFGFGLVHGFGFAAVLIAAKIPPDTLITSLAAFNIGVEIGQIAIVGILMSLLRVLDRATGTRRPAVVHVGSTVIAALGGWWLYERLV